MGPNTAAQGLQRLAIFHRQNVVGLAQQSRLLLNPLVKGPFPSGGIGNPLAQLQQSSGGGFMLQQQGGQSLKPVNVRAFRPKGQVRRAAQSGQQTHRGPSEALRRLKGPGRGQLDDQIRPAANGAFRSGPFAHHSRFPPLNIIARHTADNSGIRPQQPPDLPKLKSVASVKRVVFCHNAADFHWLFSYFSIFVVVLRTNIV